MTESSSNGDLLTTDKDPQFFETTAANQCKGTISPFTLISIFGKKLNKHAFRAIKLFAVKEQKILASKHHYILYFCIHYCTRLCLNSSNIHVTLTYLQSDFILTNHSSDFLSLNPFSNTPF